MSTGFADDDPRIGAIVGGKYRVEALIGRGGMGAVYRAMHTELGEPVAIKFLHAMFASTPELRARFRREAVALARLRHRSIVSLLDFGEDAGAPYMILELVDGRSLANVIDEGRVSLPFLGSVFDQLLEVLEVAHAAGIVHRDIKPSNVMIVDADHVKLLDFGLVQLPGASIEKLTETGIVHGTPDYMSPEQCEGKETGPSTDVYSIGVMLYECLAGDTPFDGNGAAQLMAAHLFVQPPPIASRGGPAELPRALEDLVQRLMAKTPESRPTAALARRELAAIMRGTDPLSVAELAARERTRVAALSRGERAVTGKGGRLGGTAAESLDGSTARVAIRIDDAARASSLRTALAVAGITASADRASLEPDAADVLVLSARDGSARVVDAAARGIPAVVVDVETAEQTRDVIRAGAADMLTRESPDSELATRVARLLRRTRKKP